MPPANEDAAPQEVPAAGALAWRVIGLLVLVAVLALVVSVLPGLDEVRERFHRAEPGWLAVTFGCVLASTLSYVAAVRGTLSRRPGWRASWNLGMAEQGSNVLLPTGGIGGPALGAVVLRRAGVPQEVATPRSAALFLLTSAASFVAIALAGILGGLGLLIGGISWVGTWLPAALVIAAMAGVAALARLPVGDPAREPRFAARWARRIGAVVRDGVHESLVLLRARDPLVIGGCAGYLGFAIAALGASFEAFGGEGPPLAAFVLAYTLGQVGALLRPRRSRGHRGRVDRDVRRLRRGGGPDHRGRTRLSRVPAWRAGRVRVVAFAASGGACATRTSRPRSRRGSASPRRARP